MLPTAYAHVEEPQMPATIDRRQRNFRIQRRNQRKTPTPDGVPGFFFPRTREHTATTLLASSTPPTAYKVALINVTKLDAYTYVYVYIHLCHLRVSSGKNTRGKVADFGWSSSSA